MWTRWRCCSACLRLANARGFTLKELLIILAIIGALNTLLLAVIPPGRPRMAQYARSMVQMVAQGLERYKNDWGAYPPDTEAKFTGAELLYKYLSVALPAAGALPPAPPAGTRVPGSTLGPYFYGNSMDKDGNGSSELISWFGGAYEYGILLGPDGKPRGVLVIDPGPDKLLGGAIDPQKGFIPDNSDGNGDKTPDHKDNISSTDPVEQDDW